MQIHTPPGELHILRSWKSNGQRSWKGVQGGRYWLVDNMQWFNEFYAKLKTQKVIAIDTETSGLNWVHSHTAGIVVGWDIENNYYLPIGHTTGEPQLDIEEIRAPLQEVFADREVIKWFWNEKFDRHFLCKSGLEVVGPRYDGVLLVHLLDENSEKGLKELSERYIDEQSSQWEHALKEWRVAESKARRTAFSEFLKSEISSNSETYKLFLDKNPSITLSGFTKLEINAKLKDFVKDIHKDHPLSKNKLSDISYDQIILDVIAPYACADTHYTLLLANKFKTDVFNHEQLCKLYANETELSSVLYDVEKGGIKIDIPYLKKIAPELQKEIDEAEADVYKEVGYVFDVSSNPQLVKALQDKDVSLTKLTKKGKEAQRNGDIDKVAYAVDAEVLDELASQYPVAEKVLTYRTKTKILNTYALGITNLVDSVDIIHPNFNANVSTGRMSSSDPNCQNIPNQDKTIRKAFILPDLQDDVHSDFLFLFFDFSQIELRLTASWSQDPSMLAAYCPTAPGWIGKEQDLHTLTCAEAVLRKPIEEVLNILKDSTHPDYDKVKWARNVAKRVNFGIVYGAEAPTIQRQVSTPKQPVSVEECEDYIKGYFKKYVGVHEWIKRTHNFVKQNGWVQNSFGRYRRLSDAKGYKKWEVSRACRQAVNFQIQSDAADLFKHSIVRINKILQKNHAKTRIVNFVHDEVQFYWHKKELDLIPQVKDALENWPQFSVPIIAEVEMSTRDWSGKRKPKEKKG